MHELRPLEDLIARRVDPSMNSWEPTVEIWNQRPKTAEQLRLPKFNGRITDITLQVMHEPYERIVDARQRGWSFPNNVTYDRTSELNKETLKNYVGLTLAGQCISTGRSSIGQFQAELWYFPVPIFVNNRGRVKQKFDAYGGISVMTAVTKPRIETEKFVELQETSSRIGFTVLRQQMRRPIITPIK